MTENRFFKNDPILAFLDSIPTGIVLIDPTSRTICWMNKRVFELTDHLPENTYGHICHHLICPAEKDECPILDFNSQIDRAERTLVTLDGREIPILKSVQRVRLYHNDYLCESFIEISGMKRLEQEIINNHEKFNFLLDHIPGSLWTMDTDLRFTSISGAGFRTTGRNPNDMIGKTIFEYSAQFNEKSPMVKALRRALQGLPASYEQKTVVGERYHLCHVTPIYGSENTVTGIIGIGIDITDRKSAELTIEDDKAKIRRLAHAYVKAQEKEREWITLEIHDRIIQPLSGISQALAAMGSNKTLPSDMREIGKEALLQLKMAINETRTIMREFYPTTLTRYGLVRVLAAEVDRLHDEMGCKVEFRHQCDGDIPNDIQTTFYRVAHEALLNIKKHSKAKNVLVTLTCDLNACEMTINDDGVGFDYDKLSGKRLPGGLESMKQRTEIIGGQFQLQSTKNQGTQLSVVIQQN
ncbi:MAG: PAS domain-containing sensor histidine kinase [Dehalogenimonas sp.]